MNLCAKDHINVSRVDCIITKRYCIIKLHEIINSIVRCCNSGLLCMPSDFVVQDLRSSFFCRAISDVFLVVIDPCVPVELSWLDPEASH